MIERISVNKSDGNDNDIDNRIDTQTHHHPRCRRRRRRRRHHHSKNKLLLSAEKNAIQLSGCDIGKYQY